MDRGGHGAHARAVLAVLDRIAALARRDGLAFHRGRLGQGALGVPPQRRAEQARAPAPARGQQRLAAGRAVGGNELA
jgi:hypothetical protein